MGLLLGEWSNMSVDYLRVQYDVLKATITQYMFNYMTK